LGFLHRKADFNCNEVLEKAGHKAKWEAAEKEPRYVKHPASGAAG